MRTSEPCKTSPAEFMLTIFPCFNNVRTEFRICHSGTARVSRLRRSFRLFQFLNEALVDQLLHNGIIVKLLRLSRSDRAGRHRAREPPSSLISSFSVSQRSPR